jgi:Na+/melibiose symporter-like transporter
MNTEKFKSVVRHALTAIGTLLVFFGLNTYVPLVDYLTENLDETVQAVEVLVGFVLVLFGFFRNKERFQLPNKEEQNG